MAALTTEDLAGIVVEVLPDSVASESVLSRAGATNISYNTDVVRRVTFGGASAVNEGEVKPSSGMGIKSIDVVKTKLVYKWTETDEFQNTDEGAQIAAQALRLAIGGLIKSADIAVLNGTDPGTGDAIANAAAVNLKDNATAATAEDAAGLVAGLASASSLEAVLLSDAGFNQVAFAASTSGLRLYPEASKTEVFPFWSANALYAPAAGLNGWNINEKIKNDVLAYAGDFSHVGRSFGAPDVRVYNQAIFDGVNLAETNRVGYIVEVPLAFYIEDPASFVAVKSATEDDPEA